ncbi:putative methyltransferase NSUN7 isoform X1 [Mytilus galloprovincialis]|uniref:putative methyltransferase NSUN7 isoform X1 n=1 Tax=Mytilus galloprovincialis TaxID=29158 RepID=UPI003F7C04E7
MPPTADTITVPISRSPHLPKRPQTVCPAYVATRNALRERAKMKMKMQSQDLLVKVQSERQFDFFYKEPCLYSHKVYVNSAKVFETLRHDSKEERSNPILQRKIQQTLAQRVKDIPQLEFEDDQEKRLTFELAFTALKFQGLFEDVLDDCAFFVTYPEHMEDLGLVMVILCDYQTRKFQRRTPFTNEILNSAATDVEDAISDCKTKLNAALARHRIKASAPSIEYLLPETVRSKEAIGSKQPVYTWVNQIKTSISDVIEQFKEEGFTLVNSEEKLVDKQFAVDPLCSDVLMFPGEYREDLVDHDLYLGGKIVIQDKSSCIAPHSIKHLLGDDSDIIHVNVGAGLTTAHIASLINNSNNHAWAFGAKSTSESKAIQAQFEKCGIKGIKVPTDSFLDIDYDDSKYKNVRVILVTADCSRSAVTNPVDFIVNEGEDMKILKDMATGDVNMSRITELSTAHMNIMKHAMKFSKVQAVVYMTRSIHETENENVVVKSVEYTNMVQQRKFPWRVVPPVLPFSGEEIEKKIGIIGKYIKFHPTEKSSGCFVAVVTREPEDAKEAARDVLARAQARGLLPTKKSKEKLVNSEITNGEVDHIPNGHDAEAEPKLLPKRGKKGSRKLPVHHASSTPHPKAYVKPQGVSPVASYINAAMKWRRHSASTKSTVSGMSVGSRLYQSQTKVFTDKKLKDQTRHVSEHIKVIKHPAPFR